MASTRKGRTGLEWLLEEKPSSPPDTGGEAGGETAGPPAPVSDVDAALAAIDPATPAAPTPVSAPAPAELVLTLDDRAKTKPKPAAESGASASDSKRTADPVANALLVAEKALGEAAKAADSAADDLADTVLATASKEKEASPAAAAAPAEMQAALAAAQAALREAAKATDAAADHVADELMAKRAAVEDDEGKDAQAQAREGERDADEQERSEPSSVAAHRRALASGRSTRAHPRVPMAFEVRFRKGSDPIVGAGRNVSRGGFFVASAKTLPEGEVFQAQLVFSAQGGRKMSVIAEVIWATSGDAENPDRFPAGMGCKFLDVDDRDAPFLQALIDAALRA